MKRRIKREHLILNKRIPKEDTKTVAMVEYHGFCAIMPVDYLNDNRYKLEFIKQTGVPLPNDADLPMEIPEMFCYNLCDVLEVSL